MDLGQTGAFPWLPVLCSVLQTPVGWISPECHQTLPSSSSLGCFLPPELVLGLNWWSPNAHHILCSALPPPESLRADRFHVGIAALSQVPLLCSVCV